MQLNRTWRTIIVGSVVILYILIRLRGLDASCLWFDEIFSVHAASQPWNSILSFVSRDLIHPPLFYVLLKLWVGIGGEGLVWLRLLPVVMACLAVVPFLLIAKELKLGFSAKIIALLLFTFNGSLIKYAQEVRMYSLLLFLSLASLWLFLRYFGKGKNLVPLLIVNIILVYTHYFGWFVVLAEVVAILTFQRIKWRPMLTMVAIMLASFVPWILAIWRAAQSGSELGQNIGWMSRPGISAIIQFKLNLIEPFYYAASSAEPISLFRVSVPIFLIVTVAIVLYVVNWKNHGDDEKRVVYLLLIFSILPVFAAFAASWLLPYSIWGTRHLIIVFAPVSILLAIALAKISNPTIRTAALTFIILLSGYAFVLQASREKPEYIWCAWGKLAHELILAPHLSPERRRLVVFEDLVAYHFWFELRDFENYDVSVVKGIDGIPEDPAYFLPRGFDSVKTLDINQITGQQIWIAFREPNRREPPGEHFIGKSLGRPVAALGKLGFVPENVRKVEVGDQVAYLVLMSKDPRFE